MKLYMVASLCLSVALVLSLSGQTSAVVVQAGKEFPTGVIVGADNDVQVGAACSEPGSIYRSSTNGYPHVCKTESGGTVWRRVLLSSHELDGNISTCEGTVLAEILSGILEEISSLREEVQVLRSAQALQTDVHCSGGGEYDGNTDTCSCFLDGENGYYVGVRCSQCSTGIARDDNNRNRCTLDVQAPVLSLASEEEPIFLLTNTSFVPPEVTATDNVDSTSSVLSTVVITSNVNTDVAGDYWVLYTAQDQAGNIALLNITVHVLSAIGASPLFPADSCLAMRDHDLATTGVVRDSGVYYIQPSGASSAIRTLCDMTVDGGGWTLVAYNFGVSRTFLTSTYHAVGSQTDLVPVFGSQAAIVPNTLGLSYSNIAFFLNDTQWTSPSRSYVGWWVGKHPSSTYNLLSNQCQILERTDASQWSGQLLYFAGNGANDDGCSGGGAVMSSHTCDDGGGGVTTNNSWPINASDGLWGYNCITSYSPTGGYKTSPITNQDLHAYYVR